VQAASPRHRIEHGALIRPDQLARLSSMDMTVVTQPVLVREFGDFFSEVVPPGRLGEVFRARSLIEAGVAVAGSSDRPVAPGSPLLGIQSMVQRQAPSGTVHGPQERVSPAEALAAFTVAAARAGRAEQHRGTLVPQKAADLVLLADDPVTAPDEKIGSIEVLGTIAAGRASYDPAGLLSDLGRA
jgi:predicted amidohydrolase YtcJ